jgi:hypothetical protein
VLYRRALREQVLPHLNHSLEQAGVQATVIEGGAGEPAADLCVCLSAQCTLAATPASLVLGHMLPQQHRLKSEACNDCPPFLLSLLQVGVQSGSS